MTVDEAIKNLQRLAAAGHGDLELISEDVRSGDSGSVSIYGEPESKADHHTMGRLCEFEDGKLFVPVYVDH